jgi:uncharacterized protein (TIGR02145 family)
MAFPEDIVSITPEKYQFKLVQSDGSYIICNPEPLEWQSGSLEMKRDLDAGGVFVSFVCDSLTFVGNGADLLKDLFATYEINAKCTLIISWWKSTTRLYVEFPNRFDINFNFYETVKVGDFAFGVRVKAVNNSLQTKLDNRQDTDVDIIKLVSIGGFSITDYTALKKGLQFPGVDAQYFAHLAKYGLADQLLHINSTVTYSSLPMDKTTSQFAEVKTVSFLSGQLLPDVPSFFQTALYDYDFYIFYSTNINVDNRYTGSSTWYLQLIETDSSGNIVTTNGSPYDLGEFGKSERIYSIYGSVTIHVTAGNDLKWVVMSNGINATYHAHIMDTFFNITQSVASVPATLTEGFPIYEAMERVLQHITDVQLPFYSEFFGRTDVIYDSLSNTYTSESQLRFAHIQNGLNQRGLLLSDTDNTLTLNFKSLFNTLKSIWNVGYSIERVLNETDPRVRIEEYAHFFQNVEIVFDPPLSERINKYDILSQVMPELVPMDIKTGFENFEYLTANGRAEPNTTNERTSIMNTATKLECISALRGDTKGIFDNLSNPLSSDLTADKKGDSDNFIVKTQRDETYVWIPETDENIIIESESSIFGDALLNRYFTPTRMLIRLANRITSGMTKTDAQASVLKFQKTDKSNSLITTGEGLTSLKESDDIIVSSLEQPIYKPIKHTIECLFTLTDLEVLCANPTGYLNFGLNLDGNIITGYLLSLKKKNNEDKAEITIIERVTPAFYEGNGLLYNWFTVNTGKLAPTGWHIMLMTDASAMVTLLDPDGINNNNDAGGYLKSTSINDWDTPNTGASDTYGLKIKGAGIRGYTGPFSYLKQKTIFWEYYDVGGESGLCAELNYNDAMMKTSMTGGSWLANKNMGLSARAIKDTTTLSIGQTGTVTDADGNVYQTKCMPDGKEWMTTNLKVTKLNDNTPIPEISDDTAWGTLTTPGRCWYNNISS